MFTVIYLDDFNRKHLTVVQNMMELRFFQDRFLVIEFYVNER
jgi:hypothetical protein